MALSPAMQRQLQDSIKAIEAWREAKKANIQADADFLKSIQIGVEPVVQDVVEVAVDDAADLVAEVLGS